MLPDNPVNSWELAFPVLEGFHIVGFAIAIGSVVLGDRPSKDAGSYGKCGVAWVRKFSPAAIFEWGRRSWFRTVSMRDFDPKSFPDGDHQYCMAAWSRKMLCV